MIVSLSGKPGSGKSTVAKRLAVELNYERIYIGGMFRDEARRRGMSLLEFLKWAETNDQGDKFFDAKVEAYGKTKDNFIIESRTAFHFIPQSLKLFLDVAPEEGAKRIWSALKGKHEDNRNEDRNLNSYDSVLRSMTDRIRSETLRYRKIYGLDIFDSSNYDLFLDVTNMDKEQEYRAVFEFVQKNIGK
ncbi:MAG: AAA family ATPase [Patescibacteria group bacterium]